MVSQVASAVLLIAVAAASVAALAPFMLSVMLPRDSLEVGIEEASLRPLDGRALLRLVLTNRGTLEVSSIYVYLDGSLVYQSSLDLKPGSSETLTLVLSGSYQVGSEHVVVVRAVSEDGSSCSTLACVECEAA